MPTDGRRVGGCAPAVAARRDQPRGNRAEQFSRSSVSVETMARDTACHLSEWAALLDASVPESACDRESRTRSSENEATPPFEFERTGEA